MSDPREHSTFPTAGRKPALSIFSTAKPFQGRAAVHQRNAVASWTMLRPRPEVIVFGDETGVADICAQFDLVHVPQVARDEFGIPLVSDLFAQAHRAAHGDVVCYLN